MATLKLKFLQSHRPIIENSHSNDETNSVNTNDLLKYYSHDIIWIVQGLLQSGLTILAGDPKSGKSKLARAIALDVALGRKVLDTFQTTKSNVLFIPFEESLGSIANQTNLLLENRDVDIDKGKVDLSNLRFKKLNNELISIFELCNYIERYDEEFDNLRLVVIDPLGGAMTDEDTGGYSYFKDYTLLIELQQLALDLNICVLVVHHTRKMDAKNPIHKVSGTQGLTGVAQSIWILTRNTASTKGTLFVTGREIEEKSYSLEFNKQYLEWEYTGEKLVLDLTPEREGIFSLFKQNPDQELTSKFIAHTLNKSQPSVSNLLRKLVKQGVLMNGGKYGHYVLSENILSKLQHIV